MSNGSVLGSFFAGQMLHYAGEAGELDAKFSNAKAAIRAHKKIENDLVTALKAVAPDHPLIRDNFKELDEKMKTYYRQEIRR